MTEVAEILGCNQAKAVEKIKAVTSRRLAVTLFRAEATGRRRRAVLRALGALLQDTNETFEEQQERKSRPGYRPDPLGLDVPLCSTVISEIDNERLRKSYIRSLLKADYAQAARAMFQAELSVWDLERVIECLAAG